MSIFILTIAQHGTLIQIINLKPTHTHRLNLRIKINLDITLTPNPNHTRMSIKAQIETEIQKAYKSQGIWMGTKELLNAVADHLALWIESQQDLTVEQLSVLNESAMKSFSEKPITLFNQFEVMRLKEKVSQLEKENEEMRFVILDYRER